MASTVLCHAVALLAVRQSLCVAAAAECICLCNMYTAQRQPSNSSAGQAALHLSLNTVMSMAPQCMC